MKLFVCVFSLMSAFTVALPGQTGQLDHCERGFSSFPRRCLSPSPIHAHAVSICQCVEMQRECAASQGQWGPLHTHTSHTLLPITHSHLLHLCLVVLAWREAVACRESDEKTTLSQATVTMASTLLTIRRAWLGGRGSPCLYGNRRGLCGPRAISVPAA